MSWLLAASIPGLLMLSTFGLERLENGLHRGSPSAATGGDEVTGYLERAAGVARDQVRAATALDLDEPGLPTRPIPHPIGNPQFHRTRYANPV